MKKLTFSPPWVDENVKQEVISVLDSGWITTGPKTIELENSISKYLGTTTAVSCNSWSSGAQIVLSYLGIGPGDEVIIPNYTYSATALAVFHVGATPVIMDVDENYQLDLNSLAKKVTANTKAIIPVDIGGLPVDIDALNTVLNSLKGGFIPSNSVQAMIGRIAVISDAAHSFGASVKGKKVGTLADFTVFSLHAVKNLTSAEGGIITFNLKMESQAVERSLKLLRLNGQSKDALSKTETPGNWEYDIICKGYKMNMPDICAAIALGQLKSYGFMLEERQRVLTQYINQFENQDFFTWLPHLLEGERVSSNHLMMIRLNTTLTPFRNDIINYCAANGVPTNVHFKPLSLMSAFKKDFENHRCPNSIDLFKSEISLPIYPQLLNEDVDFICSTLFRAIHAFNN